MSANDPVPSDDFTTGLNHLQDTAKWIIGIFGAIGGLLIAGTQVSRIGQFALGNPRLWVAVVGGAVALAAIGVTIAVAASVLVTPPVSIDTLRQQADPNEQAWIGSVGLLGGASDLGALVREATERRNQYHAAVEAQNTAEITRLGPYVAHDDDLIRQLLRGVKWHRAQTGFDKAMRTMYYGAGVAAFGIAVFAYAANPKAEQPPGPFRTPVEADLLLTGQGKQALTSSLGADCVAGGPIRVVVLSATSDGTYDLATVPTQQCKVARLTITNNMLGLVQPVATVGVPTPASPRR